MSGSVFEWAIIAFIIVSIGAYVWRGGQANPESTGALGHKVTKLSGEVRGIDSRLKHVEGELDELAATSATRADIARLEAVMNGYAQVGERTERSVNRIVDILVEKGLGK